MIKFSEMLDALSYTGSTLAKRRIMAEYFKTTSDPERGWALSSLAGTLTFPVAKPSVIRELVMTKVDPVLLALSRDYVGDMAETISLMWPTEAENATPPELPEVINILQNEKRAELQTYIARWLDNLTSTGRWALLKLITGNIRIGVSARLAKTALADAFGKEVDEIEQLWYSVEPPYTDLFAWLEGKTEKPETKRRAIFMPMMLAHPIETAELEALDLNQYQIELKWDGIRMQLIKSHEIVAIYSRTGDEITGTFPDIVEAISKINEEEFVLDGELLALENGVVAPFNSLQQRLNRKKVTDNIISAYPAHLRLYDIMVDNSEDIRHLPLFKRREHLETWHERHNSNKIDLSEVLKITEHEHLAKIRSDARVDPKNGIEGLMIKNKTSPYIAGRPRGHWFKWKRETITLDCVLMYAQRGSGKRSSFYSDYTFGVWNEENKLVPVGKSYSGFTDEELKQLDKWIRGNTVSRFGPVREVKPELVLEIEFDCIHASNRHKSGVAMRFPRVHRIRWDKPANEADNIENTRKLIT